MRFAIISNEATGLSLWRRLVDEGHEVLVWIAPTRLRKVGLGLVPVTGSFEALAAWGMQYRDTVFLFDCSGQGEKADFLRKRGHLVLGGGMFCDDLEGNRHWGEQIALDAGCKTPQTIEHSTISQSIQWLSQNDDGRGWYFKSNKYLGADATQGKSSAEKMAQYLEFLKNKVGNNISHILQEKLDGVDISTACYWNGTSWVGPFEGTVEHKKFMYGDIGPSTGCCFNLVWFYQEEVPRLCKDLGWLNLTARFRKEQAPPGIYDINALVSKTDGKARFLEWTPRFGYDSEPTAWRAISGNLGDVFYRLAMGQLSQMPFNLREVLLSIRLSISPYPWETTDDIPMKKTCVDTPVWGIDGLWDGMFVAYGLGVSDSGVICVKDPNGLVGLAANSGIDLKSMNAEVIDFCKEDLEITGLQYRTDADTVLGKHIDELRELGFDVPLVKTPSSTQDEE